MTLRTLSILQPLAQMPIGRVDAIKRRTIEMLVKTAQDDLPGMDLTVRDLQPADLPGHTNQEFTETSGSDNAWATLTAPDGTAIADELFMAIWGIGMITPTSHSAPIITALRFTVGASLVSQVSLYQVLTYINSGTAAGEANRTVGERLGILETPIIVRQNQILKAEEFTTTATTAYQLVFAGAVCEKVGKTLAV